MTVKPIYRVLIVVCGNLIIKNQFHRDYIGDFLFVCHCLEVIHLKDALAKKSSEISVENFRNRLALFSAQ